MMEIRWRSPRGARATRRCLRGIALYLAGLATGRGPSGSGAAGAEAQILGERTYGLI